MVEELFKISILPFLSHCFGSNIKGYNSRTVMLEIRTFVCSIGGVLSLKVNIVHLIKPFYILLQSFQRNKYQMSLFSPYIHVSCYNNDAMSFIKYVFLLKQDNLQNRGYIYSSVSQSISQSVVHRS